MKTPSSKSLDNSISTDNRMFCYLWHETTDVDECKFGERWVKAGQNPETEVRKRVRDSVGVRKDKLDEGKVVLFDIWDVTEIAKKADRYYKGSKVDDYIRKEIGFRKGTTGEVHTLDVEDMANRVNEYLKKHGQPLMTAGLSQNQAWAAENTLTAIEEGKRTIVAELCARFGKTIWSGAMIRETNAQLTVVASYVLTVFTSFKNDLTRFEQFKDFVIVDTKDVDYQQKVNEGLAANKQVVAFLSMCSGGKRQEKIDFLFNTKVNKLVMIDEADFGVHKAGQSKPLIEARSSQDVVVLMTGTNGDKAASVWNVDHYLSVTYPELLMTKNA